jgi:hypothetical protein
MASWSTPVTRATGELITAVSWNADVRDNLLFLKTPTSGRIANQATTNTTSATFTDLALATLTITPTSGATVEVGFIGSAFTSGALTGDFTILAGGTNQGDTARGLQTIVATGIQGFPISMVIRVPSQSGSTIYKVQYRTSAGTLSINNGWQFWVVER